MQLLETLMSISGHISIIVAMFFFFMTPVLLRAVTYKYHDFTEYRRALGRKDIATRSDLFTSTLIWCLLGVFFLSMGRYLIK